MRLCLFCLLLFLIIIHSEAARRSSRGGSRSSSSSSSSSRGSSWGSSRSSSSYPTQSFGSSRSSSSRSSFGRPSSSSSWGRSSSSARSSSLGRSSSSSPSSGRSFGSRIKSSLGLGSRSSSRPRGSTSTFGRSSSSSASRSSYPTQSFGSGSRTNTPIGGTSFSAPKPASTNFGSFGSKPTGFGAGGFTSPSRSGSNIKTAAGAGALGGLAGGSIGGGGFTAPKSFGSNLGTQKTFGSNLGGGGSIGGGGFTAPKSFGSNLGTKNTFGSNLGGGGFTAPKSFGSHLGTKNTFGSNLGGGGFAAPKPSGTSFGSGLSSSSLGTRNSFGSTGSNFNTGFGKSNTNFGSSSLIPNTGGARSSFGKTAGAGILGAGAGLLGGKALGKKSGFSMNPFGKSQYSSFGKPKKSFGSYLFGGKKKYGSKAPGYGTSFGTNFAGGVGKYGTGKKGFSKKALGLGVAAGFLGGAALGVGGTMATYGAIHKYKKFKSMLYGRRRHRHSSGYDQDWDDDDWDRGSSWGRERNYDRPYADDYHRNYYERNECYEGCPTNSHCEWSFCDCNYGYTKKWGRCESDWGRVPQTQIQQYRPTAFDPFKSCSSAMDCMNMDMNLICNKDLTTQATVGQCECRRDMKWNTEALECQVYLDVDCSKFTYETQPSTLIQNAVEKAQREMEEMPMIGEGMMLNRTETQEEVLSKSLLKHIDENTASEDDILEAYCRDVDAYSFEFNQDQQQNQPQVQQQNSVAMVSAQRPMILDPERPPNCEEIPRSACAVVYDEKDCLSGWKLIIPQGELRFKWMSAYYAYRNDIETIGVRSGCTLTAFSDSSFNGDRISIPATEYDRWVALGDDAKYLHMHEDIESVQCVCRG